MTISTIKDYANKLKDDLNRLEDKLNLPRELLVAIVIIVLFVIGGYFVQKTLIFIVFLISIYLLIGSKYV